jgi:hypothetical protein
VKRAQKAYTGRMTNSFDLRDTLPYSPEPSNDAFVMLKFSIQALRGVFMTVRLALTIAALAGLGISAFPAAGMSETRILSLGGDAPGFWDPSAESRCCSSGESTLALGPFQEQPATSTPTDWKTEVQAPPAADAIARDSGAGGGANQRPNAAADVAAPAVATDPGTGDLAARVAAPPQSGLGRILSAVIDLGSKR